MPNLLIIEDEAGIRESLRQGLAYQGYTVETAANGNAGLALASQGRPDLVVLDLMLPDIDGIEVCRRLRVLGDLGILMLTARDQVPDRIRGLEAGADDYLVKPFAFDELLARIRSISRRRTPSQREAEWADVADLHVDFAAREVRRGTRIVDLTTKEYDLLAFLAANHGRVLKRSRILEEVWGFDFEGESDTVKTTVNHLRGKLSPDGEPGLIHTVRGFGYILKEQP